MTPTVTIGLEEYEILKRKADSHFDVIKVSVEKMLEENEKLRSALCVVNISSAISAVNIGGNVKTTYKIAEILNKESDFYPFVKKYFQSNTELQQELKAEKILTAEARLSIVNFKNSRWGKFLAFFGITV